MKPARRLERLLCVASTALGAIVGCAAAPAPVAPPPSPSAAPVTSPVAASSASAAAVAPIAAPSSASDAGSPAAAPNPNDAGVGEPPGLALGGDAGPPELSNEARAVRISVASSGGFSGAAGDSIAMYGDGTVWWQSRTCGEGGRVTHVPAARVPALIARARRAGLFASHPRPTGVGGCSDGTTTEIEATSGDRSGSGAYTSCDTRSDALRALAAAISEAAGSDPCAHAHRSGGR